MNFKTQTLFNTYGGKSMNQILIKQELNINISKEEFLDDITCMINVLRDCYGMYEYFGENLFLRAEYNIKNYLEANEFIFDEALEFFKKELTFIKDGHFYIGKPRTFKEKYDYAIRYSKFEGIPFIDCKKFYYNTEEEKIQLNEFSSKAEIYKNDEPLIIDLRDNAGGNTTYIYDFLCNLMECEVGYTLKATLKYSPLFLQYLMMKNVEVEYEKEIEIIEETYEPTPNNKPIFVLINDFTASAAEEGIAFLKNIENVTIVGTHTAGCTSCGNCMKIYLPNSHLEVYFGTGFVLFDGKNIDAEGGFQADISYEEFLEIIKSRNF